MMKLHYKQEAVEWVEALPMGNGHIGAMAYGGAQGKFDLSENTCWSGEEAVSSLKNEAGKYMEEACSYIMEDNYAMAQECLKKCTGDKNNYGTQVPMGKLFVRVMDDVQESTRELNLENGVATDSLYVNKNVVKRESFISNPAKVMAVRMVAGEAQLPQLCLWVEGDSQPCHTVWNYKNTLTVSGRALENIHSDGLHGVTYTIKVRYLTDGEVSWSRKGLIIKNATKLVCYLAAVTSMFQDAMEETCEAILSKAVDRGWMDLYQEHCKEHASYMNRCQLHLPENVNSNLPTDVRKEKYIEDATDYDLIALFFQYGRYLILNSSRPDSLLPAALQGIWNDNRACRMEWTDDMHLDINTQMNYWPTEVTNLSECNAPLFHWIKEQLYPKGKQVAKELYGSEGFVAHTVSNAYGYAAPAWEVDWGFNVTGGAWIVSHIWEHYRYTQDRDFLALYYPILRDALQFMISILKEDKKTGELVIVPSYSPENRFMWDGNFYSITKGATLDMLMVRHFCDIILSSAEILGVENSFIKSIPGLQAKLAKFEIGKYGQIREWHEDYEEAIPDHRHTSHLLALYPFHMITPEESPELAHAAKVTLDRRLSGNAEDIVLANWAGALLVLQQATLGNGEEAGKFLKPLMNFLSRKNLMITHEGPTTSLTGGIYELDGNTGFTTGISQMLLQSTDDMIHVIPAIPAHWETGSYEGMVAFGGHQISVIWNADLVKVKVLGKQNRDICIRYKNQVQNVKLDKNVETEIIFSLEY